jgi:glycolate oxidase subunit GlcD
VRPARLVRELEELVGAANVIAEPPAHYLHDATETRGLRGHADAVVLPGSTAEVAAVLAWCYRHDMPVIPRGGGTGYAGGAVPLSGGLLLSLERLSRVRFFEPLLWRCCVEAGVLTAEVRRLARESGLLFPPDPGAAEQSQIGGNIATNAGGPHALKYGVTRAWVLALEVVVPPGDVIPLGSPLRKDVAGYDLTGLLAGSEGTLGIVTAAWLRLLPAPEVALPVAAFYRDSRSGCDAIESVLGNGLVVAALEYLDAGALEAAGPALAAPVPGDAGFLVLAEADGSEREAARLRAEVLDVLGDQALAVYAPTEPRAVSDLWRWREGVSIAVTARRGGKASEDIVVPLERLAEAIEETVAIGSRHALEACSWGHAGDGNLHSTFLVDPRSEEELMRAGRACEEVFDLAERLGGSISGEHGVGWVKRGRVAAHWAPRVLDLHAEIKRAFDPKGLLNPGKKV